MLSKKVGYLACLVALHYWAFDAFVSGSMVATISSIQERQKHSLFDFNSEPLTPKDGKN